MNPTVLHVINSSGLGGAETVVNAIVEKRNDFCFCLKKEKVQRFKENSTKVTFGTKSPFYKYNPIIFYKLFKIVVGIKPDIIHVHLGVSLQYSILIKYFFKNIKLIYHEHGEINYNKRLRFFIKFARNRIDLFIAVSESVKKELLKCCIKDDSIIVLRNFVDLDKFQIKKSDYIKHRDFLCGFAGRIIDIKGWKEFIYAAKKIAIDNLPIKFVIAGDGLQKSLMIEMINKLDISKNVKYLGYIHDMRNFYSTIDCFVLPSSFEASPMSVLEAQATGTLVLASNIPSVQELIVDDDNGILFKNADENDLSDKIIYLYNNSKLREKIIVNALKSVQKYSLTNYILGLNNTYFKLLK